MWDSTIERTDWFPVSIPPEHDGWYEIMWGNVDGQEVFERKYEGGRWWINNASHGLIISGFGYGDASVWRGATHALS